LGACKGAPSVSNEASTRPPRAIFALLADAGKQASFEGSGTVNPSAQPGHKQTEDGMRATLGRIAALVEKALVEK
jgi:hypothetical protein